MCWTVHAPNRQGTMSVRLKVTSCQRCFFCNTVCLLQWCSRSNVSDCCLMCCTSQDISVFTANVDFPASASPCVPPSFPQHMCRKTPDSGDSSCQHWVEPALPSVHDVTNLCSVRRQTHRLLLTKTAASMSEEAVLD